MARVRVAGRGQAILAQTFFAEASAGRLLPLARGARCGRSSLELQKLRRGHRLTGGERCACPHQRLAEQVGALPLRALRRILDANADAPDGVVGCRLNQGQLVCAEQDMPQRLVLAKLEEAAVRDDILAHARPRCLVKGRDLTAEVLDALRVVAA